MEKKRNWVEFNKAASPLAGGGPYVSLNTNGIITLNSKAVKALGDPEAVQFLFDIDNGAIGLKPCDLLTPYAFPITRRQKTGTHTIRAQPFMKAHQIFTSGTVKFLRPEIENGILVLDLNHIVRVTQTARKGWRKFRAAKP